MSRSATRHAWCSWSRSRRAKAGREGPWRTPMTRPIYTLVLLAAAAPLAAADRPNLVFLFADDQRYDALSVVQKEQGDRGRFPWFRTPHMDRLAAEGVRFRNAFVTLALCAPSRASFLTGRYNHLNGVINNSTPFPEDSITHA